MFKLFGRKKKEEESSQNSESAETQNPDNSSNPEEAKKEETPKAAGIESSNPEITKLSTEIDRIKATTESFGEVRKSLTERISGLSEQIGELRAMILDRDRTIQEIELKSVKAADLVETVQPEKLMIEIQKGDAKFEALKANLEGNEAIMDRVMEELKEMRKKLEFFRGVEEIVKLSEEVKKELIEIKKVEGTIKVNTDKVDTIYSEIRKKYQNIDVFNDALQELKVDVDQNIKDLDNIKMKITGLAGKEDLDKLVEKVQKYVDNLREVSRSSSLAKDVSQLQELLKGLH